MYINLRNINDFIRANICMEVKSVEMFVPGSNSTEVNPDGLFSYEIFGVPGTPDRKEKWGYIELNTYLIHPHALKEFKRIYTSNFVDFIAGNVEYGITEKKQLEKVKDGSRYISKGTGVKWLYDVWDKIEWKDRATCSKSTSNSRRFFKLFNKDMLFVNKWLVIPAFYRDADLVSKKMNDINKMYVSLLGTAITLKSLQKTFGQEGTINIVSKLQRLLEEIYTFFVEKIAGNHGFMNDYVIGKNTDYSSRLVIIGSDIDSETPYGMETDIYHSALPLHAAIKSFAPFVSFGFIDFIQTAISGGEFIESYDGKNIRRYRLAPYWTEFITKDNIDKIFNRYEIDRGFRLETIKLETEEGLKELLFDFSVLVKGEKKRPITYCEALYLICERTISDKHIFITRYPVEDQNSVYPSRFNIIPCSKHKKYGQYNFYPVIEESDKGSYDHFFVDSLKICPLYLSALQADFDGDQVNVQGVFTQEANVEAEKQMHSLANFVRVDGAPIRVFKDFGNLALFALTYKPKELTNGQ